MTRISALTALASADAGDTLPILDVSATTTKKITKTAYLSDVIDGTLLGDNSIQSRHIDWADTGGGDNGGIWWEELGRTTLGVAGDTLSLTPIAARKYLYVVASLLATGGTINASVRFNNDSGANYARRLSTNNGADAATGSLTSVSISSSLAAKQFVVMSIDNIATLEKLFTSEVLAATAGAANAPQSDRSYSKWANTANQITRIDLINGGTGDFAIGSELVVLGHD